MVAYNFKTQFAPLIESGAKLQTIRAPRKSRHVIATERMQLYTGMRTKSCRKLIPDPICLSVESIVIRHTYAHEFGRYAIELAHRVLDREEVMALAIADGFTSAAALFAFFTQTHGLPFQGVLIQWSKQESL